MAIVQTCNFYDVERAFSDCGRGNNFSRQGLRVLVDYMDELSDSMGQPIELGVVAWCCEYTEDTIDDVVQNYSLHDDVADMDAEEKRQYVMNYLQDNTIVCGETENTIVYQVF